MSQSGRTSEKGARYVYFGIAPTTDFVVDLALGLITDFITKWIADHQNLPLSDDFEKELFNLLIKAGFKNLADRLKELADLRLIPPFPFTTFTAASLPMVGIFFIGLDDFQGGFSEVRVGGTLTVIFEEGIGAQRPVNTAPPYIVLRCGSSGSLSRRFGLSGVIVKGADIPFER